MIRTSVGLMGSAILWLAAIAASAQAQPIQPPNPSWPKGIPTPQPMGAGIVGDHSQIVAYEVNNSLPGSDLKCGFDTNGDYVMWGDIVINGVTITIDPPIAVTEWDKKSGATSKLGLAAMNGQGIAIDAEAFKKFTNAKKTAIFLHEILHCYLLQNYSDYASNCPDCAHKWVVCQTASLLCALASACPSPPNKQDLVDRANAVAATCGTMSCGPCSASPQPPPCTCPTGSGGGQPCNPPQC